MRVRVCECKCECECVCVCVWGLKDQKEFGNKCEKGKGKEGERRLSASVMNSPSVVCMGRRGHCVGLCKGHPPWHIPTEFVWYMTMYTVCFYTRGSNLATECQLNTDYTKIVCVE